MSDIGKKNSPEHWHVSSLCNEEEVRVRVRMSELWLQSNDGYDEGSLAEDEEWTKEVGGGWREAKIN